MINDLARAGEVEREVDFVVVGAGTIGLIVSALLAKRNVGSVICLESGGMRQDADEHPLNEVVQVRSTYAGATHGRFRCLGGTSTRWGGALIPFLRRDLQDDTWPVSMEDLEPYISQVEALFGLPSGPYELPGLLGGSDPSHIARLAKWPAFKKRNVYNVVGRDIRSVSGPELWIHATATKFEVVGGRLRSIVAHAPNGSRIRVKGSKFIFAAGAIETTRLVLLMDMQNRRAISALSPALGRYFSDHLSVEVADVEVLDRAALNRVIGFRFDRRGAMRNLRFELSEGSELRSEIPPCFAHIAFSTEHPGGFEALRDLYRYVQRGRIPPASTFGGLLASAPWLTKALYWRAVERRLLFPASAKLKTHMVIEQAARAENKISLSASQADPYGQPLAQISWSVSAQDADSLGKATRAFTSMWSSSKLGTLAKILPRKLDHAAADLAFGGGIYHPTGSTRMGHTATAGVVDSQLRVFAVPNVHLLATSIFPTGGGSNPTMTLLLMAMRLLEQLRFSVVT